MSFAAHAAIASSLPVTPDFVSQSCCHWHHIADAYPSSATDSPPKRAPAGLHHGTKPTHVVPSGAHLRDRRTSPDVLTTRTYQQARTSYFDTVRHGLPSERAAPMVVDATVRAGCGDVPPRASTATGCPSAMGGASAAEVGWEQITTHVPVMAATMRRYWQQCHASLRPSSVTLFETTLWQFAGYLIAHYPEVNRIADLQRCHIEDYCSWLLSTTRLPRPDPGRQRPRWACGWVTCIPSSPVPPNGAYPDLPTGALASCECRPRLDKPLPELPRRCPCCRVHDRRRNSYPTNSTG